MTEGPTHEQMRNAVTKLFAIFQMMEDKGLNPEEIFKDYRLQQKGK